MAWMNFELTSVAGSLAWGRPTLLKPSIIPILLYMIGVKMKAVSNKFALSIWEMDRWLQRKRRKKVLHIFGKATWPISTHSISNKLRDHMLVGSTKGHSQIQTSASVEKDALLQPPIILREDTIWSDSLIFHPLFSSHFTLRFLSLLNSTYFQP